MTLEVNIQIPKVTENKKPFFVGRASYRLYKSLNYTRFDNIRPLNSSSKDV